MPGAIVSFSSRFFAPVPPKDNQLHALLAIASDLLAQVEAQQRVSRRLEAATRQLSHTLRGGSSVAQVITEAQSHLESLRLLVETQAALISEFESALSGAST